MKVPFFLLFFMVSFASADFKDLKLLQKGSDNRIVWSLYLSPDSGDEETNLILVIKNIGSKFVSLNGLGTDHFSLESEKRKKVKVWRINGFKSVMHNSVIVGHIVFEGEVKFDENYIFKMKEKKGATVPVSIKALIQAGKGIKPKVSTKVKLLQKGSNNEIEWSLYLGPDGENETNLILVIKNIGAKSIQLKGLESADFSLVSEKGKKVNFWRINGFGTIMHKKVIVGQIVLDGDINFKEPYIFKMKEAKTGITKTSIQTTINAIKENPKEKE